MTITEKHTEASVLAHHGVAPRGTQTLTDAARAAGIIYACLGCGSVGATPQPAPAEEARALYRDLLVLDCCAPVIIY